MKVILAEKKSVATAIAEVLGATKRLDGYFEGNGFQVTWASGHLVELAEPEEQNPNWKKWDLSDLPLLPTTFKLIAKNSKDKQLIVIQKLFDQALEIICATDSAREGELIYDYIANFVEVKNTTPQKRLWISSLTTEAIKKGFATLKPLSAFNNLLQAARCRSEADWIIGMTSTRAYTCKFGVVTTLHIGRVKTPVLALVVQRDAEIANFKSQPFFEVISTYKNVAFKHVSGRFDDKAAAESLVKKITAAELVVTDVVGKSENIYSPLLYDLTDLQKDLNVRLGFTADKTLKLAQSLYEKKYVTYPRTDSRYLSSDMASEIPALFTKLATQFKEAGAFSNIDKRFFNDEKVSDHHAIIPTGILPTGLNEDEKNVYDAIVIRFIAAAYPPCIKQVTTVSALVNGEKFEAKGTMIESQGWQVLYKDVEEKDEKTLPLFVKNESGHQTPAITQGKTTPPKAYTEATLLAAMETAGKHCEDEYLKEALKERGLGTPATRASTLEELKSGGYLETKGKHLVSTELGNQLISLIQTEKLKSPELTGEWELKLKQIEQGKYSPELFMSEITEFAFELVNDVKSSTVISTISAGFGFCPLCQKAIFENTKSYQCSGWRDGCKFSVWKVIAGKNITPSIASKLLIEGKTGLLNGFKSKEKGEFSAALVLSTVEGVAKVNFQYQR